MTLAAWKSCRLRPLYLPALPLPLVYPTFHPSGAFSAHQRRSTFHSRVHSYSMSVVLDSPRDKARLSLTASAASSGLHFQ